MNKVKYTYLRSGSPPARSPTPVPRTARENNSPVTGKPRGSGRDSGRTKLPNPRAPPMPSDADKEADGNGYGAITGRGGPLGRRLE